MKKKISFYAFTTLLAWGLNISSCEKGKTSETPAGPSVETGKSDPAPAASDVPSLGMKTEIILSYLKVKDALVATDGVRAADCAKILVAATGNSKDELIRKIRFDAEHISETEEVGHQRDHFETLSENVYELVKDADLDRTFYLQHCPMAFDGKGANWISDSPTVMNPYFGDKMLHCGKVVSDF
jgi:hypothetical protein